VFQALPRLLKHLRRLNFSGMTRSLFMFAATAAMLVLGGCASVSISNRDWIEQKPAVPEKILVRPFVVDVSDLRVDREGSELQEFKNEFSADFAQRLAERLTKYVAPAGVLPPDAPTPRGRVWVIEGRFVRLHQGSRALRAFIGFGLGQTRTDSIVEIFRPDLKGGLVPVARLSTTGGSNSEPGALLSGPFGAVPRLATQVAASGLSADARRTARTITAAISEKLHADGGKLAGRPLRAKPLGGLPGEK
jgi:hypothetical protein